MAAAGRHPGAVRRLAGDGQGSDLAGWAGYGYDRSHPRWYWGLKLYLLAAPDGMPVAWGLATPKLGEREVAAALRGWPATRGCCARGWSSPPTRAWPAEHVAESLAKGSRVVVVGRLQQRSWTAEDGSARSVVEVVAEELGLSLRWATATTTRATRSPEH